MIKDNSKIVKEVTFTVKGIDFTLRGRIRQCNFGGGQKLFVGSLSHFCKPTEAAATAYMPSLTGNTISAVERQMKAYAANFKPIGVVENEYF